MLLYLSPADYHCFHAPVDGTILSVFPHASLASGHMVPGPAKRSDVLHALLEKLPHSVSVKEYIFGSVNILTRNRRVVIVFAVGSEYVAMVIVGGITVDSIRIDESVVQVGAQVHRGQYLGGFARGGSLIALFLSAEMVLTERNQEAGLLSARDSGTAVPTELGSNDSQYGPFKVACGDGLGYLVRNIT